MGGGDGEVGDGAGIYVDDQGVLELTNSTVAQNAATNSGGGIFGEAGGRAHLNAVTVARNHAELDGSGQGQSGGIHLGSASFAVVNP